jgi:hypothetical protein
VFGDVVSQFGVHDAGLGLDVTVDHVDADDLAHPLEAQHQRPVDRVGAAAQARTRPSRDDRHAVPVGGRHDRGDLIGGTREHHSEGLSRG